MFKIPQMGHLPDPVWCYWHGDFFNNANMAKLFGYLRNKMATPKQETMRANSYTLYCTKFCHGKVAINTFPNIGVSCWEIDEL